MPKSYKHFNWIHSVGRAEPHLPVPLDRRRLPLPPSLLPPLEVENARERSTPGITTDVNNPCPLQNNKID